LLTALEFRIIYLAISYLKLEVKIYKTVILSVLYVYESCFLTLRMFANRMLRRMFDHKRQALTGGWKEFYDEFISCIYYVLDSELLFIYILFYCRKLSLKARS
jgi:hypothetical protein